MRRRTSVAMLAAAASAIALVPAAGAVPSHPIVGPAVARAAHVESGSPVYLVGGSVASINPTHAMLKNKDFYLGGYGFGDDKIANQFQIPSTVGRYATGVLKDGVHSRALMISDRHNTIAFAQIETQGYFISYKQGPFGIEDIRRDASAKIYALAALDPESHAPVPSPRQILVDSNHTHSGPDTAGVWGGVPTSYLRMVHNRTVKALVEAWQRMRPAKLRYGVAHAGVENETNEYPPSVNDDPLLTNQFSNDARNQVMDDEVRVLQARSVKTGKVIDTYVNYSSHPTVLGDQTLVSGDYVAPLNVRIEKAFGGFGMDQVGTLGRTQPARDGCTDPKKKDAAASFCAIDGYAARVMVKIRYAVRHAKPVRGPASVGLSSYLIQDLSDSPVLVGLEYVGSLIGVPGARSIGYPWFTASLLSTTTFSGHIGKILISGGPGEMYPQIVAEVRRNVPGMQGYINIGTAGDFLGYLISPLSAYPEPIRRSMLSGNPPPMGDPDCGVAGLSVGCPDPIGNDNFFFNVSPTLGMRITCSLLRGAADTRGKPESDYLGKDSKCHLFANDLLSAPGDDTKFPAPPDMSKTQPHM